MSYCLNIVNAKTGLTYDDYSVEHFHNITYNLASMLKALNIYPYDLVGQSVKECLGKLHIAELKLLKEPEKYKKYEASNGWGTINTVLTFIHDVDNDWKKYPDALVSDGDNDLSNDELLKWCSKFQAQNTDYYKILNETYFNKLKKETTLEGRNELFFLVGGSRLFGFNDDTSDYDFYVILQDDINDVVNNKLFAKEYHDKVLFDGKKVQFKIYDFRKFISLIKKMDINLLFALNNYPLMYINHFSELYADDINFKLALNELFSNANKLMQINPLRVFKACQGITNKYKKQLENNNLPAKRLSLTGAHLILLSQYVKDQQFKPLNHKQINKLKAIRYIDDKNKMIKLLNECEDYLKSINQAKLTLNEDMIIMLDNICVDELKYAFEE